MKMNTHVFNARLYVEGLKRLRVLGFGVLILALTTSLLIPLTHMLESDTYYDGLRLEWVIRITEMSWKEFSVATRFMPLLAPMFFYVSFSFLLKRREADVFHAIPYKRTCVYLSFVASALTWVWGIQLLSSLLSAIMWTVDPFATFTASTLWTLTGTSMLLAALLGGFMLLSLTVCGNQQTVILNFFLFALLPRFLIWQFGLVLEDTAGLINIRYFCDGFFESNYFLPWQLFLGLDGKDEMLAYPPRIIWTALATLVLFVGAGVCYRYRRSESVGQAAPNAKLQHLYRCLFTLPFAVFLTTFLLNDGVDEVEFIVLLAIALLAYYLYELITTKRLRNLLTATKYLPAVVSGCLIFALLAGGVYFHVGWEKIEADEIRRVEFRDLYWKYDVATVNFEYRIFENFGAEDKEEIESVAHALAVSQKVFRSHKYGVGPYTDVDIYLQNGRVISRSISRDSLDRFACLEEQILSLMPTAEEVSKITVCKYGNITHGVEIESEEDIARFLEVFQNEYATLTREEQLEVKDRINDYPQMGMNDYDPKAPTVLHISGEGVWSSYVLTDSMSQSKKMAESFYTNHSFDGKK